MTRQGIAPTFIVAGAWKSGSSALADSLAQHPDVIISSVKEPAFFSHHYDDGLAFYDRLYPDYSGQRAIGEASAGYLQDSSVPARIHNLLPNVRLVFILRHPVDRAISNYYWRRAIGQSTYPLSRLVADDDFTSPELKCSQYGTHFHRFLRYFQPEQLHVVLAEEFRNNPCETIVPVFSHIGVSEEFIIAAPGQVNPAVEARSQKVAALLSSAQKALRAVGAGSSRHHALTLASRVVSRLNRLNRRSPSVSDAESDQLASVRAILHERLLPEIELTESLLNISLERWKLFDSLDGAPRKRGT